MSDSDTASTGNGPMQWCPHVTVAAIVERDAQFLLVEEVIGGRRVLNQPAGHLERGESLQAAVCRETREETAWEIRPRALVGIYRYDSVTEAVTFVRFTFAADPVAHDAALPLDPKIVATHWLSRAELEARQAELRSPLVLASVRDFQAGRRATLDLLQDY